MHVIRLKERIEKHRTYCYTEDTNTDSSISSLGLDQFDGNDVSDSDSDDETVQTKENSISPTIPYKTMTQALTQSCKLTLL